ncbi:hypothetical protein [Dokdonella soli]|uniref:DUF4124 domain-containing protein n=1 Tax=Dokdonella soli TaxID=529810 RepID=A0ABN1IMF1_9GAMM
MRAYSLVACGLLGAALSSLAIAQAGSTGQTVHRCVGRHGEIVFSGLPCAAGESAAISAAVATTASAPQADAACPASREELRDRVAAAIARRDPNALAGLLRWQGVGASAAGSRLRALRDIAQRPLLAIDSTGAVDGSPDDTQALDASDSLRVRTGSNESGGVREHAFGVGVEGGCYWLVW